MGCLAFLGSFAFFGSFGFFGSLAFLGALGFGGGLGFWMDEAVTGFVRAMETPGEKLKSITAARKKTGDCRF